MLEHMIAGLFSAIAPINLIAAFLGTFSGIMFGALPGFTPSMGIAVLIPFTYAMDSTSGLIFLAAIYCGAFYGGSISAILVNTPGTPAAAATAIDGYQMTLRGRSREALVEAVVASFWGGVFSVLCLLVMAPLIASFSLKFGATEKFMMAIFGLAIIASLSTKSITKGLIGGLFGLALACVGSDPVVGLPRYTFGVAKLLTGISTVPALIGLYSIPQIVKMVTPSKASSVERADMKTQSKYRIKFKDLCAYPIHYIRSSIIGLVIGIIPGPGGNTASFMAYNQGKMWSKKRDEFGTGCREALACTESSNNAVTGGSLIPMLTLGIPGNAVSAVLMGALMMKGLAPGASLFTTRAGFTYTFMMGLLVANVFMLLLGLVGAKYFSFVALIPNHILAAGVGVLCMVGSFAAAKSMVDVYIMLLFGAIGLLLNKYGYDSTPVVLGLILGGTAEQSLAQAKLIFNTYDGVVQAIFTRPISLALVLVTAACIVVPFIQERLAKKAKKS